MRGMTEKEFAQSLKDSFLSVWIDEDSGHGTFPLESMACGVPVLAKTPNLQPDWINENNGLWVQDKTLMADYIADFIQNWLEDNIKPTLIEEGKKTAEKYQNKQEFEEKVKTLFESYLQTRADAFELQIKQIS
jgi:glycosyltransferase involved in cell wall biosynthesis